MRGGGNMGKEAYKDIWVFAEQEGGRLSSTTFELLAKSHDLKQKLGGGVPGRGALRLRR